MMKTMKERLQKKRTWWIDELHALEIL
jgi:hypothetical protein